MTARKIIIDSCSTCPHRDHLGGFAAVAYVPYCQMAKKKLPHTITANEKGRAYASASCEIPDWCPLPENVAIKWTKVSDQWPPIGEYVLTASAGASWPAIESDRLEQKSDGLCYWEGGNDFDDVTHWAPIIDMPSNQ